MQGEKAQQELPESGDQNSLLVTNGANDASPSSGDELTISTEPPLKLYVKPATDAQGCVSGLKFEKANRTTQAKYENS